MRCGYKHVRRMYWTFTLSHGYGRKMTWVVPLANGYGATLESQGCLENVLRRFASGELLTLHP